MFYYGRVIDELRSLSSTARAKLRAAAASERRLARATPRFRWPV